MHTFTDNTGDSWSIVLLRPQLKQVKAELGIDLLAVENKTLWMKLIDDLMLLGDLASILLQEQIKTKGLNEEGFAKRFAGEGLENFCQALLQAIVDFFPPRKRAILQQVLRDVQTMQTTFLESSESLVSSGKPMELAHLELQLLEQTIDQKIEEAKAKLTGGKSSTNGAASPGRTPTA